jgi:hypothetical protein
MGERLVFDDDNDVQKTTVGIREEVAAGVTEYCAGLPYKRTLATIVTTGQKELHRKKNMPMPQNDAKDLKKLLQMTPSPQLSQLLFLPLERPSAC